MAGVLISAISYFASFLRMVLVVRVLLSWIPIRKDGSIIRIIYMLSEPMLGPIRSLIRKSPLGGPGMTIDFSPLIALALIGFVSDVLIRFILVVFK